MNIYAPSYYERFRCIAGRCRHTCCAGWEIDIDEDSLLRYRATEGSFGEKLNRAISEDGTPHFILGEGERCPLLNGENLCELILHCGEDALCQICADHPRFRSYWSDRIEVGLGLVCEEAARIILTDTEPLRLVRIGGDGSEELSETERGLLALRRELLESVPDDGPSARLKEYLIYRHLADALYDDRLEERIAFIERAHRSMTEQWKDGDPDTLAEIARRFSDAVEYDDEALDAMIENSLSEKEDCYPAKQRGRDDNIL